MRNSLKCYDLTIRDGVNFVTRFVMFRPQLGANDIVAFSPLVLKETIETIMKKRNLKYAIQSGSI